MTHELRVITTRTKLEQAFRLALLKRKFLQLTAPVLTQLSLEPFGGGSFSLDYYGRTMNLAQSPQCYKQLGIIKGIKKLFVVSENIRKPSKQMEHFSTEFTSWDFEVAGVSRLERLITLTEAILLETLPSTKQPFRTLVISLEQAQQLLNAHGYATDRNNFDSAAQAALARIVRSASGERLIFITSFPAERRGFYYRQYDVDGKHLAHCFDILFCGIEIGSGGLHEHRYIHLVRQAKAADSHIGNLKAYLHFFKHNVPPHGGVSLSPARIVQAILNLPSTTDTVVFPRSPKAFFP